MTGLFMRFACVLALAAGCASTNAPPGSGKDMAGGNAICPNHSEQCGGMCCGTRCADIQNDPRNCGGCGNGCVQGQLCQGGRCGCQPSGTMCGTGQTCCGSAGCKSLDSDAFSCGDCGKSCGSGATCSGGQCLCGGKACAAGQVCCNGACASSCANDMGTSPPDMSGQGGVCQCSNHCANALFFPICVGPECCFEQSKQFSSSGCPTGACQANSNP